MAKSSLSWYSTAHKAKVTREKEARREARKNKPPTLILGSDIYKRMLERRVVGLDELSWVGKVDPQEDVERKGRVYDWHQVMMHRSKSRREEWKKYNAERHTLAIKRDYMTVNDVELLDKISGGQKLPRSLDVVKVRGKVRVRIPAVNTDPDTDLSKFLRSRVSLANSYLAKAKICDRRRGVLKPEVREAFFMWFCGKDRYLYAPMGVKEFEMFADNIELLAQRSYRHMRLGNRFQAIREEARLPLVRLVSSLSHIPVPELHEVESGRRPITIPTFLALCDVFGVEPAEVLRGVNDVFYINPRWVVPATMESVDAYVAAFFTEVRVGYGKSKRREKDVVTEINDTPADLKKARETCYDSTAGVYVSSGAVVARRSEDNITDETSSRKIKKKAKTTKSTTDEYRGSKLNIQQANIGGIKKLIRYGSALPVPDSTPPRKKKKKKKS